MRLRLSSGLFVPMAMSSSPQGIAPVQKGDVLDDKYRVEKILGVGGMGVVVAARHVELDTHVALKFMLPDALTDPESVQRFSREARAMVRLKNAHSARVFDVGKLGNGAPYMTDPQCSDLSFRENDGGGPTSTRCTATPAKVPGIAGAVDLVVAERHACARTATGSVFCWGQNRTGALGNPDAGQLPEDAGSGSFTAVQVQGLPNDVFQISTAIYSGGACAVSDGGRGWCWGNNIPNQPYSPIARAITEDGGEPPAAAEIPNLTAIQFGLTHACALRKDGSVVCWGRNDDANLGIGGCDTPAQHVPATVVGLPNAAAVDTRWLHSCALDDSGKVWCWGVAQDGALGNGVITGTGKCSTLNSSGTATQVPGLPRIVRIATGIETTFAVDENGALWGWGANDVARVGHPPTTQGDFRNCGDPGNQTTCNPRPMRVEGLP